MSAGALVKVASPKVASPRASSLPPIYSSSSILNSLSLKDHLKAIYQLKTSLAANTYITLLIQNSGKLAFSKETVYALVCIYIRIEYVSDKGKNLFFDKTNFCVPPFLEWCVGKGIINKINSADHIKKSLEGVFLCAGDSTIYFKISKFFSSDELYVVFEDLIRGYTSHASHASSSSSDIVKKELSKEMQYEHVFEAYSEKHKIMTYGIAKKDLIPLHEAVRLNDEEHWVDKLKKLVARGSNSLKLAIEATESNLNIEAV